MADSAFSRADGARTAGGCPAAFPSDRACFLGAYVKPFPPPDGRGADEEEKGGPLLYVFRTCQNAFHGADPYTLSVRYLRFGPPRRCELGAVFFHVFSLRLVEGGGTAEGHAGAVCQTPSRWSRAEPKPRHEDVPQRSRRQKYRLIFSMASVGAIWPHSALPPSARNAFMCPLLTGALPTQPMACFPRTHTPPKSLRAAFFSTPLSIHVSPAPYPTVCFFLGGCNGLSFLCLACAAWCLLSSVYCLVHSVLCLVSSV